MSKPSIVCVSQDPDTIFSYGLQVGYLIDATKDEYDWHVISSEYTFGKPFKRNGYTKWANEGEQNRCTRTLNNVIDVVDPICVFSMGDIHHHRDISVGKPLQVPWISWFPWDNHDPEAMYRYAHVVKRPEIKVTMSKFAYNFMSSYGFEIDELIYNIVDVNTFKPISEDFREQMDKINPEIEGKKVLLFVGRPNWRKNIEFLLSAFAKLCNKRDDLMLYLHVDFNDSANGKPNLNKLIHGLGIRDKIINTPQNDFVKGVTKEELNHIYNLSDLYVTTHSGEGFGLPICEAMACEKPFVATDCTTTQEFKGKNNERGLGVKVERNERDNGVVRPWCNIDDFVKKCEYLLERPELMNEMGKNGRKFVKDNASLEVIVPKWKKVFKKLDIPVCTVNEKDTYLDIGDHK